MKLTYYKSDKIKDSEDIASLARGSGEVITTTNETITTAKSYDEQFFLHC